MSAYNKREAKIIIEKAERSIRIVRGLLAGATVQDIVAKETPSDRTLVIYYQNRLLTKND